MFRRWPRGNIIQGSVLLDDEASNGCTELVLGFHHHIAEWSERNGERMVVLGNYRGQGNQAPLWKHHKHSRRPFSRLGSWNSCVYELRNWELYETSRRTTVNPYLLGIHKSYPVMEPRHGRASKGLGGYTTAKEVLDAPIAVKSETDIDAVFGAELKDRNKLIETTAPILQIIVIT